MSFEEWWDSEGYNQSLSINGAVLLAFKEIALKSWSAAQREQRAEDNKLIQENLDQLNYAVNLLAEWCVAVDEVGTDWDSWDEYYKEAMYRDNPCRPHLDAAIDSFRSVSDEL